MARQTAVNSGYTLITGASTGSRGSEVDTWLEYAVLEQDEAQNCSRVRVLLYAAAGFDSATKWSVPERFGYVGCDADIQYGECTYDFGGSQVNCFADHTYQVRHDADGTKKVTLSGGWSTGHSTYISGGSASGEVTLKAISRAAVISEAGNVKLGSSCKVTWTPNASSHHFKLRFSLGNQTYDTQILSPKRASSYTYTGYTLPLEAASAIDGDKTAASMQVCLYTYGDSEGSSLIGSHSTSFTVTVPNNKQTQPTVSVSLTPVKDLQGLYVQGVSRVQATVSAAASYGSGVVKTWYEVADASYESGESSGILAGAGTVKLKLCAANERGFTKCVERSITVQGYSRPTAKKAKAFRCTGDGVQAEGGTYLKLQATRSYEPLTVNGTQYNFCTAVYKLAPAGGSWGEEKTLLAGSAAEDTVSKLLNLNLDPQKTYKVMLILRDTVGKTSTYTLSIPSERIYQHKPAGGKGMGLGKYCQSENTLDTAWSIASEQNITAAGTVSGKNVTASNDVTATGTVSGKNVTASNNVTATGTVSGKSIAASGAVKAAGDVVAYSSEGDSPFYLGKTLQSAGDTPGDTDLNAFITPGVWWTSTQSIQNGAPSGTEGVAMLLILSPYRGGKASNGTVCCTQMWLGWDGSRKVRLLLGSEVKAWTDF